MSGLKDPRRGIAINNVGRTSQVRRLDQRTISRRLSMEMRSTILSVVLPDERQATEVIRNTVGHCDHFDVSVDFLRLPPLQ